MMLVITQAGLSLAPRVLLDEEAWMRFVTQDPDFEHLDGDLFMTRGDVTPVGLFQFQYHIGSNEAANVQAWPKGDSCLRAAYRVARHFDARVLWSFESRSIPDAAGDGDS